MRELLVILLLATGAASRAEIIDRIAVTVDRMVITERHVSNHLQIAAFLNDEPQRLTATARQEAARRLVDQTLVRREMEISRYPVPAISDADRLLEEIKSERFPSEESFREALSEYGLDQEELREGLRLQLTILRFIEYRFRPGITVTDEDVERYYNSSLVPESRRLGAEPGALDEVRDTIEEVLIGERVNQALDRWLEQATAAARVVYREEAFQ